MHAMALKSSADTIAAADSKQQDGRVNPRLLESRCPTAAFGTTP